MNATEPTPFETLDGLRALGFGGFLRPAELRAGDFLPVPSAPGVYAVLREPLPPRWLNRSLAPAWRGMDPSEKPEVLAERWVEGAALLYLGVAPGPGVRNRLQQRIKRMLRFGQGRVVAHWGGRRVWQLADHAALRVAWMPCDDPAQRAAGWLAAFVARFERAPFAQEEGVHGEDAS